MEISKCEKNFLGINIDIGFGTKTATRSSASRISEKEKKVILKGMQRIFEKNLREISGKVNEAQHVWITSSRPLTPTASFPFWTLNELMAGNWMSGFEAVQVKVIKNH